MSNKTLQELLASEDKKVNAARNPLARLWRLVLYENNIQHGAFDSAINRYLERLQNHVKQTNKEQHREKGNLVKELSNDALTFKNFIKGMQVLNPAKVKLTIDIQWQRGRTTRHSVDIDLLDCDSE